MTTQTPSATTDAPKKGWLGRLKSIVRSPFGKTNARKKDDDVPEVEPRPSALSRGVSKVKNAVSRGMSSLTSAGKRLVSGVRSGIRNLKERVRKAEDMLRLAVIALSALMATFLMIQWLIHLFSFWMGIYLPILVQWYYIPVSMTAGILVSKNVIKKQSTKGMYMLAFVMSVISIMYLSIQISEIGRSNNPTWQWIANAKCGGKSACTPPTSYTYAMDNKEAPFDHYPAQIGGDNGLQITCDVEDTYMEAVTGKTTWRPANCPCLNKDDADYLHDLSEDFNDADDEDIRDDFGNRGSFPPSTNNECFLHPLYDGTIVLTKGMSRENVGGKDNGLLVVTHNQNSLSDFTHKHMAVFALDIVLLVLLLITMILSGLILWVYKVDAGQEQTGPLDRSVPLTKAQMMGKYTSYVLMVIYGMAAFVGFLAYVEGYYLHLRLQLLWFVPTLAVGIMLEVPAKRARAAVSYFNNLKLLLTIKHHHFDVFGQHELSTEEHQELLRYQDNDTIDDKIKHMEDRVPKYRELYGATSPAFNLSFIVSIFTMVVGIYGLAEYQLESERYGNHYLDKMATSGVRTIPNSNTTLWLELPDSLTGQYLKGLYQFAFAVNVITVVGGILLTASCAWRLFQSVSNWKKMSMSLDIEELSGGNHDDLMDELFGSMNQEEVENIYAEASGTLPISVNSSISMSRIHNI